MLSDLEAIGYATRPFVVPACAVNAPHKRNRVWIIAHADSEGESGRAIDEGQRSGKLVGNAEHDGSSSTAIRGEHKEDARGAPEGRKRPSNLREQVDEETIAMWPTPTAMTGGTGVAPSHKNGKHGWNTGAAVNDSLSENPTRMWPTPTARDYKDTGENTNYEAIAKKSKLSGAVMFPTPTANEDAAGTPKGKMQKMLGNDPEVRGVSPELVETWWR